VIEWRGTVSSPGAARKADGGAKVVSETIYRPISKDGREWTWELDGGKRTFSTADLATRCLEPLKRL
jgi:hypothetical protein